VDHARDDGNLWNGIDEYFGHATLPGTSSGFSAANSERNVNFPSAMGGVSPEISLIRISECPCDVCTLLHRQAA
jgi:hypothetical protein